MIKNIKKVFGFLLLLVIAVSCGDDDRPNPTGLTEITLSSFSAEASGDGTIVTVTPVSIGASSYVVDFGDPNSDSDVITIAEQGGSTSYDYPNESAEVTYTITVTAQSDEGFSPATLTNDVTVVHTPPVELSSAPSSPNLSASNVYSLFSDGMETAEGFLAYRWGQAASAPGGVVATVGDNSIVQLSRLGTSARSLEMNTV
ncbi:MAG: hypothetical protein AAGA54_31160, partial [Myxococcota bacterium]